MTALKALGRLLWSPVRPSENWAQTLVRVAGNLLRWVIGLPLVAGLMGWGVFSFSSWWKDRPYRLTGLEGVEIGMTPTEVTLIKGGPQRIIPSLAEVAITGPVIVEGPDGQEFEFPEGTSPGIISNTVRKFYADRSVYRWITESQLVIENPKGRTFLFPPFTPEEVINATIKEHEQGAGAFEQMKFDHLEVNFDRGPEGTSLVSQVCLRELKHYNKVIGVSGSDTEADIIRHLGQPDTVKVDEDGLVKRSSFYRYNILIGLERARVTVICVGA